MNANLPAPVAPSIFSRLPAEVFRLLATDSRELMWELLVVLHDTFFGPDATQGEESYLRRFIIGEIERFLVAAEGKRSWNSEEGWSPDTPLNVRANQLLDRLVATGWLVEDTEGVRKLIAMTPTMQKFLELLMQYAEEGPKLVGGKVQNIYNNLKAIQAAPREQAASLHETAKDAKALIASLSGTGLRVKEVVERLSDHDSTASMVAAFFKSYVSEFFIRDYHELRTSNHPLRHKHEIISIVLSLRDSPELREPLIIGYQRTLGLRTKEEAEAIFERDVGKLLKLQDIQRFLDRLDESIARATRKALSQITYQLRVQGRIEQLISQTIAALTSPTRDIQEVEFSLAPGALFSIEKLRTPVQKPREPEIQIIRRATMSPEQRAMSDLRRAMSKAREVSRPQLKRYADAYLPLGKKISSDDLPIRSVSDLVILMTLSRAVFFAGTSKRRSHQEKRSVQSLQLVKELRLELVEGKLTKNEYVTFPQFYVTREGEL